MEAWWRSVKRALDYESRIPGFDPNMHHRVVSLSKTHELPTVLVKPRKRWLRLYMTEKLLTGTLSLNTNKTNTFTHIRYQTQQYTLDSHNIPRIITNR